MFTFRSASISILLIIISLPILGQSDFRPGYYITNDADTIHGLIDYRGDVRNSRICVFKVEMDSEPTRLGPEEIYGFGFTQGKFYISKWFDLDPEGKYMFVEYLVNGIADLYYLRDISGSRYFLEMDGGSLIELTNEEKKVEIDGRTFLKESKKHVGLLKASFSDCEEIQGDLDNAFLSHKSLINITSAYHDYICDGQKCIIYQKEIPILKVEVAPLLGFSISSIDFGMQSPLDYFDFNDSYSPYLGVQFNLFSPKLNEKISFPIEVGIVKHYHYAYNYQENTNSFTHEDVHLNTIFMQNLISAKYKFPTGKFRPTMAIGGLFNLLVQNNTLLVSETVDQYVVATDEYRNFDIPKVQYGWMIQLGLDYHINWRHTLFTNLRFLYSGGANRLTYTRITTIAWVAGLYL